MKILSLIVPAYNSAAFLPKCLDSFLCSDVLEELDVVVVDDGSADETARIAQSYCRKYPASFRLIRQENRGHGGALNTGSAAAVGKYLKVIDADDWVISENLPEFVEFLKGSSADVVLTDYQTLDICTGEVRNWRSFPGEAGKAYTLAQIMGRWKDFDRCLTFHGIAYRTEFYHRFGIRLSERVFYEDHEFAAFPCCRAEGIAVRNLTVYVYRIGDKQQSVSPENQLKRQHHTRQVLQRMATEYRAQAPCLTAAGREYVSRKTAGLLLGYLITALLGNPDRGQGRRDARAFMVYFRGNFPGTAELVQRQYGILRILNRMGVSKACFDRFLRSRVYNLLRGNRNFD